MPPPIPTRPSLLPTRPPLIPSGPRVGTPGWRKRLQMASFKSAPFYVDQQGRASGRRTVLHQYPKRDLPYAEDMGREAMRYQITGYLVMAPVWPKKATYAGNPTYHHFTNDEIAMLSNYDEARDLLEAALCSKSPGRLLDPYNPRLSLTGYGIGGPLLFMCERYTITESRERGGMCSLEMAFVEAGIPGNAYVTTNTGAIVSSTANDATAAAGAQLNNQQSEWNPTSAQASEAAGAGGITFP